MSNQMLSKWRIKRKMKRISRDIEKLTAEIIKVKSEISQNFPKTNTPSWDNYIYARDTHIDKVISGIIRKEIK